MLSIQIDTKCLKLVIHNQIVHPCKPYESGVFHYLRLLNTYYLRLLETYFENTWLKTFWNKSLKKGVPPKVSRSARFTISWWCHFLRLEFFLGFDTFQKMDMKNEETYLWSQKEKKLNSKTHMWQAKDWAIWAHLSRLF